MRLTRASLSTMLPLFPSTLLGKIKDLSYLRGVLMATYGQDGRRYHNLDHIQDLLIQAKDYQQFIGYPDEFTAAILFHDTVYELARKDNEFRSAMLWDTVGWECFDGLNSDRIFHYIMATVHDGKLRERDDVTKDEMLLADMDLWTFALPYEDFSEHGAKVELEYRQVYSADEYRYGRKAFLQGMLARPFIFYHPIYKIDGLSNEAQARQNIQRALAELA